MKNLLTHNKAKCRLNKSLRFFEVIAKKNDIRVAVDLFNREDISKTSYSQYYVFSIKDKYGTIGSITINYNQNIHKQTKETANRFYNLIRIDFFMSEFKQYEICVHRNLERGISLDHRSIKRVLNFLIKKSAAPQNNH